MQEEVLKWWKLAERDLDTAEYNFRGNKYYAAAFFCQQAAEKALKALDLKKSGKIIRTHDLLFLCNRINAPESITEKCIRITPVYTESRYADFSGIKSYTISKVKEILSYTREVLKWAKENLNI